MALESWFFPTGQALAKINKENMRYNKINKDYQAGADHSLQTVVDVDVTGKFMKRTYVIGLGV